MTKESMQAIIDEQAKTINNLTAKLSNMLNEIALLREQVAYLMQKRYGKSSEQGIHSNQMNLFNEEPEVLEDEGDLP